MTSLAVQTMAGRLTTPFARGASTLVLSLQAGGDPTLAQVAAYDFSEYKALFNEDPQPRYILTALQDIPVLTQVSIDYTRGSSPPQGSPPPGVTIPAGTLAGASFALDIYGSEDPGIRIQRVHMSPPAPDGVVANWLGLTALLGNLAKLLWVIGWERDHIRRHLTLIHAQHHLPLASDYSLDLFGYDLGVPRFPPQPYSYDPDTIALYHLDDLPAGGQQEVSQVEDIMQRYGNIGHPGTNVNADTSVSESARSGAVGRFGTAFAFRNPNAEIQIPAQAEFDLGVGNSFTVECFVKPDPNPSTDGNILAKHPDPADATKAGWALSIGTFNRGLPFNVRFLLSDGTQQHLSDGTAQPVTLFADQSLTTDRFYHLAGVIDRGANEARLYVDGQLLAVQNITGLGSLVNTEPVRMGRTPVGTPLPAYLGVIDEVRFSRTARSTFHPVLGEEDDTYRRRLEIFARWTLPTLPNLLNILNDAVGKTGGIGGDLQPLLLNDTNAALVGGTLELTVQPNTLTPDACIDFEGNRRSGEADVNGTAAAETTFDPIFLITHNDPRATYVPPPARTLQPGELPPDPHKMQVVTARQLDQLLDLLATTGISGLLQVVSAFDPEATDLRAVGRGLLLTHPALSLDQLAAQAHRAGFSFVCNRSDLNAVYVSTQPGDYIDVTVTPVGTVTTTDGFDLVVNQSLTLGIQPALPPDTFYRWSVIPCGAGQAGFTSPTNRSSVTFTAAAPGILNVKVEVTRRQGIGSGTRTLRIGPLDLAEGASIGADGSQGVTANVAGAADDFFHSSYLVTHADPRVIYGTDVNTHRMQPSVAQHLNQLLALLSSSSASGQLQLVQAYVPGAGDLTGVGRALTLQHSTLAAGTLAVLAHAAGFTYVARRGNQVLVRQEPGELVTVTSLSPPGLPVISEGAYADFAVGPRAKTSGIAVSSSAVYVANSGTDTVSEIDPTTGLINPARVFKVGWNPVAVALSPDGKLLYTADRNSNTVTVVDLVAGNVVHTLAVRPGPVALVHHPTNAQLYVACHDDNSLLAIDTTALNILNTLAVGAGPIGVAIAPDGSAVWVALNGASQVAVVGTNPFAIVGTIGLNAPPLKIAIASNGTKAYATLPTVGSIAVLDVAGRTVTSTPQVGQTGKTSSPAAVAVAPDSSAVYVTDTTSGSERVYFLNPDGTPILDTDGKTPVSVCVQQEPLDVAAVGTGQNLLLYAVNYGGNASNFGSDVVSVINPQQRAVAQIWLLGSGLGESLTWVLRLGTASKAHLNSTTLPQVRLFGDLTGPVLVRAVYLLRNNAAPYTFEIRLKPNLEAAGVFIRKEQYDLIMNILNAFHPVGVEIITLPIRERVIEVRDQLLSAFPDYTYPNFRVRGPIPRRT
jgi:YVTN family beta-propeller protein